MENYAKREFNDVIENRFAVNEMEIKRRGQNHIRVPFAELIT